MKGESERLMKGIHCALQAGSARTWSCADRRAGRVLSGGFCVVRPPRSHDAGMGAGPDRLWRVAIREPGGQIAAVDTPSGYLPSGKPTLSATTALGAPPAHGRDPGWPRPRPRDVDRRPWTLDSPPLLF
jgi:hypothetical protein